MQAHGGQLHEVEPAGIHASLREASVPHDAAVPETGSVPAPGEESLSEAPSVTREGIVKLLGIILSPGNRRYFPDVIATNPPFRQPALSP